MKTTIPFKGFYESIHDGCLTDAFKGYFRDDQGDLSDEISFDLVDWRLAYNGYAKSFTDKVSETFGVKLTFAELSSPKEYNFETDRIFCDIELKEVQRLFNMVKRDDLAALVKERFTDRSGFISFYSSDLDKWSEHLQDWDINQVGTLVQCYLTSHEDFSEDWEFDLMSELNERAFQIIEDSWPNLLT